MDNRGDAAFGTLSPRASSSAVEEGTINHPARFRRRVREVSEFPQQIYEGGRAPSSPSSAITRSPVPLYAERARRTLGFFWLSGLPALRFPVTRTYDPGEIARLIKATISEMSGP